MTKQALTDCVLAAARLACQRMIDGRGSFRPVATFIAHRGDIHSVWIEREMHGSEMADFLRRFSTLIGGADAIVYQSDAKMKPVEIGYAHVSGSIARDPQAQEILITAGRSREHSVFVGMQYSRTPAADGKGDIVVFTDPEPRVDPRYQQVDMYVIPNIWSDLN